MLTILQDGVTDRKRAGLPVAGVGRCHEIEETKRQTGTARTESSEAKTKRRAQASDAMMAMGRLAGWNYSELGWVAAGRTL
jgi:hypothetical protein